MKSIITTFIKENKQDFVIALALAATYFLFAPISTVIKNAGSLNVTLGDLWPFFIRSTIIAFVVICLMIFTVKPAFNYFPVLLMAITFGLLIQGNFLIYNLSVLNGSDIPWDNFKVQSWLEILMWFGIIVVFQIFRKPLYKHAIIISICLLLYSLSTNVIPLPTTPSVLSSEKRITLTDENEFDFSKDKNVVLIVLDSFTTTAFDKLLENYPEFKNSFKDFTYYKDSLGGYPTTSPSVPLILTGEYNDNTLTKTEYLESNKKNSIPYLLQQNGIRIESYSFIPFYADLYENKSDQLSWAKKEEAAQEQYYVSGIRYMPLFLKRKFVETYYQGQNYVHKDIVNFVDRVDQTRVTESKPVFKFIHLSGAQAPNQLDGKLNRADKGYLEQAGASLRAAEKLINELKRVGAYNKSLIIIVGDHGSQPGWKAAEFPSFSAQPLMLAKRFNQHFDKIHYSDAKVTNGDIPKSIADELGIKNQYPGYSIFGDIPSDRIRRWFYYDLPESDTGWSIPYLPEMYEFEVNGPAYNTRSFRVIKKYEDNVVTELPSIEYQYGDNIIEKYLTDRFFSKFSASNFAIDPKKYWGLGPQACIYLPIEPVHKQTTLSLAAKPYLKKGVIDSQTMEILVDDISLATLTKGDKVDIVIPKDVAEKISQDGTINLCFNFPSARSPKELGIGKDTRKLAYEFTEIILK